jgi:peptidoglycan DL-endopeptidase CwlO
MTAIPITDVITGPPQGRPPEAAPAAGAASAFASSLQSAMGRSAAGLALQRSITLGEMAGTTPAALAGLLGGMGAPGLGMAGPGALGVGSAGGLQLAGVEGPATASESAIIQTAHKYLGVPYKWGGTNPATGLDCSGFTQRVFADLGVAIPRVSIDQSKAGTKVASMAEARPGDLVFRRGSPNHIGIYAGDGQFIHAPRSGDVVKVAKLTWTPDEIRRVA